MFAHQMRRQGDGRAAGPEDQRRPAEGPLRNDCPQRKPRRHRVESQSGNAVAAPDDAVDFAERSRVGVKIGKKAPGVSANVHFMSGH